MTTHSTAASAPLATLSTVAILGVASVLAIMALIRGPTGPGSSQFQAPGQNILTLSPVADTSGNRPKPGDARSLTNADVDAIARNVPDIAAFSRVVSGSAPVVGDSAAAQIRIQGVDPTYTQVTSESVARGTFFSTEDANAANRVAILGQTLAASLFTTTGSPIGRTIRIRNVPFTVIGVLSAQSASTADNPDDSILIPFQTGQVRLFGPGSLDAVLLRVSDGSQTNAVSQQVAQLLRQRRQVRAGQPDGFTIRTSANTSPAVMPTQWLGQVLQHYRQYACEAKGLCSQPQSS